MPQYRFCSIFIRPAIIVSLVFLVMTIGYVPVMAQKTNVVIVFDNSGSMQGIQCDYANYSLKLLASLLDDDHFILKVVDQNQRKRAKDIKLESGNRQSYLNLLAWSCGNGGIYVETVETAADVFGSINEGEQWMIILSDGLSDQPEFSPKVIDFARKGGRIIYINTDVNGNQGNYLDAFLRKNIPASQLEMLQTNSNPQEILKTMDYIARLLQSADAIPLKYKLSGNTMTLTSVLPLKSLTIIEQNRTRSFMDILSAVKDGQNLPVASSLKVTQSNLTGSVHRISGPGAKQVISAGEIKIDFSKAISSENLTIIAQPMADVQVRVEGDILSVKDNVYKICSDQVKMIVSVVTSEDGITWHTVGKDILSKTGVKIEFLSRKIDMQLKDSVFVADIRMDAPYFPVNLTARYEGYFNIKRNAAVLDRDTCSVGSVVTPPMLGFTLDQLMDGDFKGFQYMPRIIVNGVEREVTPEEFKGLELKATDKDGLELQITKSEKDKSWYVKPAVPAWCLCFLKPGKRIIDLKMISSDGSIMPVKKELEIDIRLDGTSFWERCGKLIIGIISILIFLWYIYGVITKRRFYSGAMIEYEQETDIRTKPYPGVLKTNFFNRYMVPYLTETNTIEGITFKAGSRSGYIEIPKEMVSDNMSLAGIPLEKDINYNPKLSDGEALAVSTGNKTEYYTYFSHYSQS